MNGYLEERLVFGVPGHFLDRHLSAMVEPPVDGCLAAYTNALHDLLGAKEALIRMHETGVKGKIIPIVIMFVRVHVGVGVGLKGNMSVD